MEVSKNIADIIELKAAKYHKWVMAAFEGTKAEADKLMAELLAINVKLSEISDLIGTGPIRSIEDSLKSGLELPAIEVEDAETMAAMAEILG